MSYHNPKERGEELLAEVRHRWRLNDLGQLVVNNKYLRSGEVGMIYSGSYESSGYFSIRVLGTLLRQHHIVWYLHTGEWPKQPLDHIDGDGTNNHPDNLRLSTSKENTRAFRRVSEGVSSKWRGVSWCKVKSMWRSRIMTDGGSKHLGRFTCEKEAALAFNYAAIKYGFSPEALNQVFAEEGV